MKRILLNVGCGTKKLPGFVNIDLDGDADLKIDVNEGLPFQDNSVDGIFCEHFIEHLSFPDSIAFLRECRRVLKWGGVVRIATPDLRQTVNKYLGDWNDQNWMRDFGYTWIQTPAEMLNVAMRYWGHQWLYDEDELVRLAEYAGLTFRARCEMGESESPELRGLEYRKDSLIVEFTKEKPSAEPEPLVSILIPAYNPRFFEAALRSALGQTYSNIEVIVTDDCPDSGIEEIVKRYSADPRLRYSKNVPRIGISFQVYLRPLGMARGSYIKFLNDDDMLAPTAIETMVKVLQSYPEVSLVTSHRQRIDESGNPLEDDGATRRPVAASTILRGAYAVNRMLAATVNYIGEPSTPMFRRSQVERIRPHPFSLAGVEVDWNVDVTLWMNLLSQGDLCYLTETLSYFRQHSGQQHRRGEHVQKGVAAWNLQRQEGARLGFFAKSATVGGMRTIDPPTVDAGLFPDIATSGKTRLLLPVDQTDSEKAWLDFVASYLDLVHPGQGIVLVLWAVPATSAWIDEIVSDVTQCAERLGVDLRERSDVILEGRAFGEALRKRLYRSVTAYLAMDPSSASRDRLDEVRACGLPVLSPQQALDGLREGAVS